MSKAGEERGGEGRAGPVEFPPWTVLGESRVVINPFFAYRLDHVQLPGGSELRFAYADRMGASLIVPVTPAGEIVLIRQYRYTVRETLWEVPAGTLEGEAPEVNARKELKEEIGGEAASLEYVGHFFSSPGASSGKMYVFLARGVTLGEGHLEETEQIAVVPVPIAEALRMARAGEITNGPCALALLLCEPLLLREG